jgi:uncharacterized SAM-binding protein YcdF (DUF218 family)
MVTRRQACRIVLLGISTAISATIGTYIHNQQQFESTIMPDDTLSHYDVLVAHGGGVKDGKPKKIYETRLDEVARRYLQKKSRRIVTTGGVTSSGEISEAQAGLKYLQEKWSLPSTDILIEKKSKSTAGNIYYSKLDVFEPYKIHNALFVGSDFMVPRIRLLVKKIIGPQYKSNVFGVPYADTQKEGLDFRESLIYWANNTALSVVRDGDHETVKMVLGLIGNSV